jgi:hypothetical protein
VGILAIQLPKILGGSSAETAADTTATSTVSTEPGGSTTPETPTAPTSVPVSLTDTDQPLPPDPGKLRSLGSFAGKDPFVQQVKAPSSEEDAGPSGDAAGAGGGGEGKGSGDKADSTGFTVGEQSGSATVISVNGERQVLAPGALFPSANPVFVLVGEQPKAKTVTIGVAGGEYQNGAKATKLHVGKPLVLVNTTTDAKYRLVLVAVGDGTKTAAEKTGGEKKKGSEKG